MSMTELLVDMPLWVAIPAVMIIEFFRRLLKGDLVLGREHLRVVEELDRTSAEAARVAEEQKVEARRERERLVSTIDQLNGMVGHLMERMPPPGAGS